MEAHYSPIFQSLESEVLFKCLMSRSHNLWSQSNRERKGYPRQVMFSFFGSLKTCETLQMAMFANIECLLGFLPSLDMYAILLTSYLSRSSKLWNFVHARIICF